MATVMRVAVQQAVIQVKEQLACREKEQEATLAMVLAVPAVMQAAWVLALEALAVMLALAVMFAALAMVLAAQTVLATPTALAALEVMLATHFEILVTLKVVLAMLAVVQETPAVVFVILAVA